MIADELKNSGYNKVKLPISLKSIQGFAPETGGTPIRSLIISTWRSGSTFFGDILNAIPGNFYHYEPLNLFNDLQLRNLSSAEIALKQIKKLLSCNFTEMDDMLLFVKSNKVLFQHNKRLWTQCELLKDDCFKPEFLEPFCKLFSMQSMKLVRLRMKAAKSLLSDLR